MLVLLVKMGDFKKSHNVCATKLLIQTLILQMIVNAIHVTILVSHVMAVLKINVLIAHPLMNFLTEFIKIIAVNVKTTTMKLLLKH